MKPKMLLIILILGAIATFSWFGTAGAAQDTEQVIPIVNVDPTASLSIVSGTTGPDNNLIDFGNMAAGSTQTKPLVLGVTANDAWTLTVSKGRDLKDDITNETIPSANFTFTSSGPAGPTYVTSDTEFGTIASPANVVTNGSATSSSNISITYKLVTPDDQPTGYYTAPYHTYTLIVP
jgi:hypothetical protein